MISGLFRRQRTGTTGSGFGHAVVADDADCTSVASSTPSDAAAHVDPVTPGKQQRRVTEQRSPKFKEQPRPVNMMLCCNEEKLNELLEEMLDSKGIPEASRQSIRSLAKDTKWLMLNQHHQSQSQPKPPVSPSKKSHSSSAAQVASSAVDAAKSTLAAAAQSISAAVSGGQTPVASSLVTSQRNTGGSNVEQTPVYFIQRLRKYAGHVVSGTASGALPKLLVALRVSLSTQSMAWVQQFIGSDGVSVLLAILSAVVDKQQPSDIDFQAEYEILKCLKTFMNSQPGMDEILNRAPASINLLALCAVSHNVFARKLVFEMLTVLCYASGSGYDQDDTGSLNSSGRAAGGAAGIDGHHLVVDAFNFVRDERGERVTYELWMEHLGAVINSKAKVGASGGLVAGVGWLGDNRVTDKDLTDYMTSSLMLMNAVICLPEDVDYRMHLRNQFYAAGFTRLQPLLATHARSNEYLLRQVERFSQSATSDWAEYCTFFDHLRETETDPQNIFKAIVRSTEGTAAYTYFLSLCQHLLAIRQEPDVRANYYHLIDSIVCQIVLDGRGLDPDFSRTYDIDLTRILTEYVDQSAVVRAGTEVRRLQEENERLARENASLRMSAGAKRSGKEEHVLAIDDTPYIGMSIVDAELVEKLEEQKRILEELVKLSPEEFRARVADENSAGGLNATAREISSTIDVIRNSDESPDSDITGDTEGTAVFPLSTNDKTVLCESSETAASTSAPGVPPPPMPPMPPPGPNTGFDRRRNQKPVLHTPSIKLKPLFWEKVPDYKVDATIWKSTEALEKEVVETLVKAGEWSQFEEAFAAAENKASEELTTAAIPVVKEVSVINAKTAYNLNIILARVKQLTLDELRQAVLQLDETVLPATLVKQLRNYLPTADDRALLQPYKDDVSRETLARADRFMLEMDAIFHYDARLWVMELRAGYDERVQEMVSASRAIVDASKALRDADGFHQVLHCLLALGNVMNQNTFRGGAHGFRIQSLNRVVETKASKSGPNLLEYAVRQLLTTTPVERLAVGVELRTVGPAAKVSLPQLLKDMSELEEDVQSLAKEMDALTVNDATDPFIPCVRPFHAKASADLARLRAGYEDAVSAFKDVVKLYGEEDAEWTTKDFFGIFETFSVTIERTKMAVLEKMERDERRAAIELKRQAGGGMAISAGSDVKATESASAATDNMEQEAVGSGANGGSSANIMNDSRKGQMDALLESIRRGQHPDTRRDVASALNKSADSLFSATQVPRTTRMIKRNTIAADLRRVSIGNVTALTEDLLSQLMGSVTMFEEEGASDEK